MLRFRVTRTGERTLLAQIIRLVDDAQASKADVGRLADRVAGVFVPIVLSIAAMTLAGHAIVTSPSTDWASALRAAISVLVVACPCAMGLATPTAIMVASGRGAEMGILVRQAQALEEGGRIDTVVLDKTGTVTQGTPTVIAIERRSGVSEQSLLAFAASAEVTSSHPLAHAVIEEARKQNLTLPVARSSIDTPGGGISADVDSHRVLVGKRSFLKANNVPLDDEIESVGMGTTVHVAVDGKYAGRLLLADPIKATSGHAVKALRDLGLEIFLVTGDAHEVAEQVAGELGIALVNVRSEVSPADKESIVRELRTSGHRVAMVGDGVNDAPALAAADLGISMGQGSDIAKEAGDIVLTSSDLASLVRAIHLCRCTLRKIKENLVWAFGYNIVLIPLAAFGYLPPLFSALAMAASSVSVVTNSLLIRRVRL